MYPLPGIPDSPWTFFLSEANTALDKDRLQHFRIRRPAALNLDVFRRSLARWHIWIFVFTYNCLIIAAYLSSYMNLWLKAEGYAVVKVDQLPTIVNAVTIVASWLGSTLAAVWPAWTLFTFGSAGCLFSTLCMVIWDIPVGLKYFAWYLFGVSGMLRPIVFSTVNTVVKDDSEERALIMGALMTLGCSFNIWVPLLLFPTAGYDGAPRWRKGWPVTFAFWFLIWAGFIVAILLHRRDAKSVTRSQPTSLTDSEAGTNESAEEVVVVPLPAKKEQL